MQISSRFISVIVTVLVSSISTPAQDSQAQAAARQALEKRMGELQSAGSETATKPPAPGTSSAIVTPTGVDRSTPSTPLRAGPNRVSDTVIVDARSVTVITAAPATPTPGNFIDLPEPSDPIGMEKATDAVREKYSTLLPELTREPRLHPPSSAEALPPLPSVRSSLPAHKQDRLQELLNQYKADILTPEQYHKKRAEILAGP